MAAEARKASLTAKCLYELQMPFLLVFRFFQSHGLVQHPSLHCRLLAIARAFLGDIWTRQLPDYRLPDKIVIPETIIWGTLLHPIFYSITCPTCRSR